MNFNMQKNFFALEKEIEFCGIRFEPFTVANGDGRSPNKDGSNIFLKPLCKPDLVYTLPGELYLL